MKDLINEIEESINPLAMIISSNETGRPKVRGPHLELPYFDPVPIALEV